ncbi:hypothetical protein C8Q70DRAFT_399422 [Cubamyces menziesii]|uniref:Uncharacterized protein n=1 Tax=Trametes cubensis TaxID=1111947 RepID=A0AAD7TR76_9APHY|nr:hypothetical protein C8Q70DRAFT_399422 [Cubamyces menziesii]KAJ8473287.1 hypothetical protein ONZ51_g7969 [Trametes cubensis]
MAMMAQPSWAITQVKKPLSLKVWVDDGRPVVNITRGGANVSVRLMVASQGFLDITSILVRNGGRIVHVLDFNNVRLVFSGLGVGLYAISLAITGYGTFSATVQPRGGSPMVPPRTLSGRFKPFPRISPQDAAYLQMMIQRRFVPYQKAPGGGGIPYARIRALGQQLFPWTPYSYILAMATYDWTTASFARMVFMQVFQYTSIPPRPFPLDRPSISKMIFQSKWGDYNPGNPTYMRSFMMRPAKSESQVAQQLAHVARELQRFSAVQNRLLVAAAHALPRTCILAKPYLFSGQVDIYQMGMSRFGICFFQFPGNRGPVGTALEIQFAAASATFLRPGRLITTKMVWSFTDTEADALHYANGILLVVRAAGSSGAKSFVWDMPAYVTKLSNEASKTEYIFPAGSTFRILANRPGNGVQVIELEIVPRSVPWPRDEFEADEADALGKVPVSESEAAAFSSLAEAAFTPGDASLIDDTVDPPVEPIDFEVDEDSLSRDDAALAFDDAVAAFAALPLPAEAVPDWQEDDASTGEQDELLAGDTFRTLSLLGDETTHHSSDIPKNELLDLSRLTVIPELDQVPRGVPPAIDHVAEDCTGGRWCRCVQSHMEDGTI